MELFNMILFSVKKRNATHLVTSFCGFIIILFLVCLYSCHPDGNLVPKDHNLIYQQYYPAESDLVLSREKYADQLYGFWLGQCIANWTGLITEMDKIGGDGKDGKASGFYTRENWGGPDQPNLWNSIPLRDTIDFYFEEPDSIWGADDDTDIEYMYQHLLYSNQTSILTPHQIRDGWMKHIKAEEENYLWVSNQQAYDLMKKGIVPPETSDPELNPFFEMIDAQLTTEIFGFFAPTRPDIALKMAHLPIRTTARKNAEWISQFHVIMYALASVAVENSALNMEEKVSWLAAEARKTLPEESYAARMYDFVKAEHAKGNPWETTRDELHEKYQVRKEDGYTWSTDDPSCNGCFAAGINFGAGLISWFYGAGDFQETIKIGALAGWDSDNPTATWGGLLGFMLGKKGIEKTFNRKFADKYYIHRTRINFPNNGIDSFKAMAEKGLFVVDRVIQELVHGGVDLKRNQWFIPTQKEEQENSNK
jgi:hypothetical protein